MEEDPAVVVHADPSCDPAHPFLAEEPTKILLRPAEQVLSLLLQNDSLNKNSTWYESIHEWSQDELDLVLQAATTNTQTTSFAWDLKGFQGGLVGAIRVAQVVGCFDSLYHIGVHYASHRRGERTRDEEVGNVIDGFLNEMGSSRRGSSNAAKLKSVTLDYCGGTAAWLDFLDRYSSIETLSIGDDESESVFASNFPRYVPSALALGFGRLPSLRQVYMRIYVLQNSSTSCLFQGLARVPQLEEVEVVLHAIGNHWNREEGPPCHLQAAVNDVAGLCALCNNLTKLRLELSEALIRIAVDFKILLEQALFSESLEYLILDSIDFAQEPVPVSDAESDLVAPARHAPRLPTNQSLTCIRFSYCFVDESCYEILSCFRNLESIFIDGSFGLDRSPRYWTRLFSDLKHLQTFHETHLDESSEAIIRLDSRLSAIASAVETHESMRDLRISTWAGFSNDDWQGDALFPSLTNLLAKSKGSLSLSHKGNCDANVAFLCDGVDSAQDLSSLKLKLTDSLSFPSALRILAALKRNRSIVTCTFNVRVDSMFDPPLYASDLVDLMALNRTIQTFCLTIRVPDPGNVSGDSYVTGKVLEYVAAGLRRNQTLERVVVRELASHLIASSFVDMLQHNTSLKYIDGMRWELSSDEKEIEYLLTLNRYHRHLLVLPPETVPRSLWNLVLGKILSDDRMDVLYYFLRQLYTRSVLGRRGIRRAAPPHDDEVADE